MTTKDNNKKDRLSNYQNNPVPTPTGQGSVLALDVDYYQSMLDDTDITEDQKREFIETLWSIVVQFVDLGFGVHPLQQAREGGKDQSSLVLEELLANMGVSAPEDTDNNIARPASPERIDG